MKVSVVVPTFRRPEAIRACVAALQAQQIDALEIVVVDDGSPEPVSDLPDGPHRTVLLRQGNAGPAAARNRGVAAARGALICLTDDDCRPRPGWAAAYRRAAEAGAKGLMAGRTVNAAPGPYAAATQEMTDYLARTDPAFAASNNVAIRRDDYLAAGGFPEGFARAAGEDRAFSRACAALWPGIARVPEAVLDHHHALDAARFWRQHRNYGHGAHGWHAMARAQGMRGTGGAAFYWGLVTAPLARGVTPGGLWRAGLLAAAQAATAQGWLEAARDARRTRRET